MDDRIRYADIRPYTVPDTLEELTGPTTGRVHLPVRLDWSEQKVYELEIDGDLRLMYETVIREAMNADDLRTYLNGAVLVRTWPRLWLPKQARGPWEARFSQLRKAA